DAAAGAVDDADPALHACDGLRTDEPARLGRERRVDGDEVGARKEIVERDQLHAQPGRRFGRHERIVGDHLHAQADGALGDDAPDVAEADDAEGLVADLSAEPGAAGPFARTHGGGGLRDVARQREQHGDGVLGGGDVAAAGRVHHHDAARGGGVDVDVVDADAGTADHAQLGGAGQHVGRHLGGATHDEGVVAADDVAQ